MKHFITLAVAGLLMTANVMAQDSTSVKKHKTDGVHHKMDGKKHGKHKGGKALEGVELNDAQKAQAKTIHEDFKKKAGEIKAKQLPADEQKKQLSALHKEHRQKLDGVLTAEQKATLAAKRKQHAEKIKRSGEKAQEAAPGKK